MWEESKLGKITEAGTSSHILDSETLLICGGAQHNNHTRHRQWLQCRLLCLNTLKWKLVDVNTAGALNRSYHAAATVNGNAYLFGGILDAASQVSNECLPGDCVICSLSQEGVSCISQKDSMLSRYGWTAVAVGTQNDAIALFGGKDASGMCSSDVILCKLTTDGLIYEVLPCEGERPTARAFYAAAAAGPKRQYMVISGGHDGQTPLTDTWILDISNGLPEVLAAQAEQKDTKPSKGAKKEAPLFAWTKIALESVPRAMHHCSITTEGSQEILRLFGGTGVPSLQILNAELDVKSTDNKAVCSSTALTALGSDTMPTRYGFSVAIIPDDSGGIASYLVIGGSGAGATNDVLVYTFSPNSFTTALAAHHAELKAHEQAVAAQLLDSTVVEDAANSEVAYPNGDVYEGQVSEDGARHGQGTMRYASGDTYVGHWENGERQGSGRLDFGDGNCLYEGFFDKGVMQGFGRLIQRAEGRAYEGEFVNGQFHGQGKLTDTNGIYEGEFERGQRKGTGKLTKDGEVVFEGQWADDEPNGYGRLVIPMHDAYSSEVAKFYEGLGISASGQFEGSLLHGKPHGHGICRYLNEEVYDGAWRNGRRNGFGTYTVYKGQTPSSVYKGKWVANQRSGHGVLSSTNGYCYDGQWAEDKPHGIGKEVYSVAGDCYEGEFQRGERHGTGKMIDTDGDVLEGKWIHGKYDQTMVTN